MRSRPLKIPGEVPVAVPDLKKFRGKKLLVFTLIMIDFVNFCQFFQKNNLMPDRRGAHFRPPAPIPGQTERYFLNYGQKRDFWAKRSHLSIL
jgi:hypothetical protein